ncbi:MAG: serine--tRNA ligase, partial [Deltaproteobacteria bacterium]|nr:serine--tRNA ligase [Deltaproteobacteria bacterium]
MLDPRILSEKRDEIVESCRKRQISIDVDAVILAQERHSALLTELNEANRRRNEHQKAGKRKLEPDEREQHVAEGRRLKDEVAALEARVREQEGALQKPLRELPNFIHPDTPEGGEEDFRELRRSGEIPSYDFEPRDHLALCETLDLADFERAAKVAGAKFYYLKNEAALLELGLQRFALEVAMQAGFTPVITMDLARPDIVEALGFSPRGEETQIYSIADHDLCLVGTAEITLGGMHANTLFDEDQLPIKLAGVSHCFRTEAGAHGRES